MSDSLTTTIALYAAVLAAWSLVDAVRGGARPRLRIAGLVVLEVALVAQGVAAAVAWLAGSRPEAPATFAGYLVASVVILPVVASPGGERAGPWDAAVSAIACLAVAVVALRLAATWRPAG